MQCLELKSHFPKNKKAEKNFYASDTNILNPMLKTLSSDLLLSELKACSGN